jgi:DNA-binding response OmpR family regulator
VNAAAPLKVLLIDSNVLFNRRLSDALKQEGFEVVAAAQSAFALTMLEWNTPAAILCATNLREMGAHEVAQILHADTKTAQIPVIALGDGGEQALMAAFSAGCAEYVDRKLGPQSIAAHVRDFLRSRQEGFQPTQMLGSSDSQMTSSLQHLELSGVIQMLGSSRQTGALHINAGAVDGLMFFDAGEITHAESGNLFGDEAVIHIVRNCEGLNAGVCKFNYGSRAATRTVLRSATDLMLDAMREFDEKERNNPEGEHGAGETVAPENAQRGPQ